MSWDTLRRSAIQTQGFGARAQSYLIILSLVWGGGAFILNRHMFHLAAGRLISPAAASITHHQLELGSF